MVPLKESSLESKGSVVQKKTQSAQKQTSRSEGLQSNLLYNQSAQKTDLQSPQDQNLIKSADKPSVKDNGDRRKQVEMEILELVAKQAGKKVNGSIQHNDSMHNSSQENSNSKQSQNQNVLKPTGNKPRMIKKGKLTIPRLDIEDSNKSEVVSFGANESGENSRFVGSNGGSISDKQGSSSKL